MTLLSDFDLGYKLGIQTGYSRPNYGVPITGYTGAVTTPNTDFKNGFLIGIVAASRAPISSDINPDFYIVLNTYINQAQKQILGDYIEVAGEISSNNNSRIIGKIIISGSWPNISYSYYFSDPQYSRSASDMSISIIEGNMWLRVVSSGRVSQTLDLVGLTLDIENNSSYPLKINVQNDDKYTPRFVLGETVGEIMYHPVPNIVTSTIKSMTLAYTGGNIAVDSSGNIYVTTWDTSLGRFYQNKYDSLYNLMWTKLDATFGTKLALDSSSNLCTNGITAARYVTKRDQDGNSIWSKNIGPNTSGIEADPYGYIYVHSPSFVYKLDTNGNMVWSKAMSQISDIAVDTSGNLYVASLNLISKFTSSGTLVWQKYNAHTGLLIATYSEDCVYVASNSTINYISKLDSDGQVVWTSTVNGSFTALVVDSSDNVYAANSINIYSYFWYDGSVVFSISNSGTAGLAVDSVGNIYATSVKTLRIFSQTNLNNNAWPT